MFVEYGVFKSLRTMTTILGLTSATVEVVLDNSDYIILTGLKSPFIQIKLEGYDHPLRYELRQEWLGKLVCIEANYRRENEKPFPDDVRDQFIGNGDHSSYESSTNKGGKETDRII